MSRHLCRYRVTDDSLLHPMKYYVEKVLTKSECKPLCVKRTAFIPFSILCLRNLTARLTRLEQSSLPQICDDSAEKKKYPRKKGGYCESENHFRGNKDTSCCLNDGEKIQLEGCHLLFPLFTQNKTWKEISKSFCLLSFHCCLFCSNPKLFQFLLLISLGNQST